MAGDVFIGDDDGVSLKGVVVCVLLVSRSRISKLEERLDSGRVLAGDGIASKDSCVLVPAVLILGVILRDACFVTKRPKPSLNCS
jgi:hypothetical protein